MESKKELQHQVDVVIGLIKERLEDDPTRPIFRTLLDRYVKAQDILLNGHDLDKIVIKGGCRAYLHTFSDYMNPLLIEMDKAEQLFSVIGC